MAANRKAQGRQAVRLLVLQGLVVRRRALPLVMLLVAGPLAAITVPVAGQEPEALVRMAAAICSRHWRMLRRSNWPS